MRTPLRVVDLMLPQPDARTAVGGGLMLDPSHIWVSGQKLAQLN